MHKSRRELLRLAGCGALVAAVALGRRALALDHIDVWKATVTPAETVPSPDDHVLLKRIKAISNVFEVGRAEPDYAYVEDLGDGRGYTVTQYGFCTYNSEVAEVIGRYAESAPDTPLQRFLPSLPPRVPAVTPGSLAGFPEIWREEIAASELLGLACDEEADRLYVRPALAAAAAAGIRSPIGKSIFYDTWLQHGASKDPDSLPSILKRTIEQSGDLSGRSETDFLSSFLAVRKAVLTEPHNQKTRDVWRASARRVDALQHLLSSNPDLAPPIEVRNADIHVTVF